MQPGDLYLFRGGDGIAYYLAMGSHEGQYVGSIGFAPESPIGLDIAEIENKNNRPWDLWQWDPHYPLINTIDAMASCLLGPLVNLGRPKPGSFIGLAQSHDPTIMNWMWAAWVWEGDTVEQAEEKLADVARLLSQYARELAMAQ